MRLSQIFKKDTRTEQERVQDIRKAMFRRHAAQRKKAKDKAEKKAKKVPFFKRFDFGQD